MDRRILAASIAAAALGLALVSPAQAADKPAAKEKCYGINANAKNDCAAGAHSCAGQATKARDPNSFVYLPAGACSKIDGGKLSSS